MFRHAIASLVCIALMVPLPILPESVARAESETLAATSITPETLVLDQSSVGGVTGMVTGLTGSPVAGAYVQLQGLGGAWSGQTDPDGRYHLKEIPDGTYTLNVSAQGYALPTVLAVKVENTRTSVVNPTLGCTNTPVTTRITADTVWRACRPYNIDRAVFVTGARLTIEPGTIIKFGPSAALTIERSNLEAAGDGGRPIIFTSQKDDVAGGDTNGDGNATAPAPGNWYKIAVTSESTAVFDHAEIRYALTGIKNDGTLTVHHTAVRDVGSSAIDNGAATEVAESFISGFQLSGIQNRGPLVVRSTRFSVSGDRPGISSTQPFTLENSEFEGTGMTQGTGIDVSLKDTVWDTVMIGNTFRNLRRVAKFFLNPSGFGPAAAFRGNRTERVAQGTIELNGRIGADTVLPVSDLPWGYMSLDVPAGITLRIQPGTIFKGDFGSMSVYGTLLAEGRAARPVVFTSLKDDSVGGDSNGDGTATRPAPADWGGMMIHPEGSAYFRHVLFRYGGESPFGLQNWGRLDVRDSVISYTPYGIRNSEGGNLTVRYTDFTAVTLGVDSFGGPADIRYNYWGAVDGPQPGGHGTKLDGRYIRENGKNVWHYDDLVAPWLTQPVAGARQLGPSPWADMVGGVNTATGNYTQTVADARVEGGLGIPVAITRTYNSLDGREGPFGRGWSFSYEMHLWDTGDAVFATLPTGQAIRFLLRSDGTYESEESSHETLLRRTDGSLLLEDHSGMRYRFGSGGELLEAIDRNENHLTLGYDDGRLTSITDAAGRQFTVTWRETGNLINAISDPAGQQWTYTYAPLPGGGNVLTGVSGPGGSTTRYGHDDQGRITEIKQKISANEWFSALRLAYDSQGRVLAQFDADGNRTTFAYDDYLRTTTVTDPLGAATVRQFDLAMRQIAKTDPLGYTESYVFDDASNLIEHVDKNGDVTRYVFDERGNRLSEILPATPEGTAVTRWEYHPRWNIPVKVIDANGQETNYLYDDRGNLRQVTDRRGQPTSYAPDARGLLTSVTDPRKNSTTFTYDQFGHPRTARVPDPFGYETVYEYDILGRVKKITDASGNITVTTYTPAGQVSTRTDADGTTTYTYDLAGRLTAMTEPLRTTTYSYNSRGLLERESRQTAPGETADTVYTYDAAGRTKTVTDPLGNLTVSEYDAAGRRISVTVRASDGSASQVIARYEYDGTGNVIAETDANGNKTRYKYDAAGRVLERLDPGATRPAAFAYDLLGRKVSERDASGIITTFAYDPEGHLIEQKEGLGQKITHQYDGAGNLIATTDARGYTTTFGYDQLNRQVLMTDPYSGETSYGYDALGNRSSITDPERNMTRYDYDPKGRLIRVTEPGPEGAATSYSYDAAGNLTRVTDALGRVRQFRYDLGGRLLEEEDPEGQVVSHTYDLAGNLKATRDIKGQVIAYTYDYLYRLKSVSAPGGIETRFTYDANGNRTAMTDATGTTTYHHDGLNRLVRLTAPDGKEIAYRYDEAGRLLETTGYDGAAYVRAYEGRTGRLDTVTGPGGATIQFTYDAAGNRTGIRYANGVTGTYQYDLMNRISGIRWEGGAGALAEVGYQYDRTGRVRELTDSRGPTTYHYDERGRLVRVEAPEATYDYAYDRVGNRKALSVTRGTTVEETTYTYDSRDQLTQVMEPDGTLRTFAWDANGNQTSDGRNEYEYDSLNRLVGVRLADGRRIAYRYDGDGLLVARQAAEGTTQYYYDGSHPYLEVAAGAVARNLVVEGLPLMRETGTGTVWYLTDRQRDVVGLADLAGALVGSYAYDAFGVPISEVGGVSNPLRYAGEPWDEAAGLYYLRARHYAPALGRFITQDTYKGSPWQPWTQNLYAYCGNNPVNYTDPTGHMPRDDAGGGWLPALERGLERTFLGQSFGSSAFGPANPLPANGRYVRVIDTRFADGVKSGSSDARLSSPRNKDVFITAADDVAGIESNAALSKRLSVPEDYPKTVVEFEFTGEPKGIASPVNRDYPEFVPGGKTGGGAREWTVPNQPVGQLPIRIIHVFDVPFESAY